MQIYESLKRDHERLKALLKKIDEVTGGRPEKTAQTRDQLLDELKTALLAHTKAEEAVFYSQIEPAQATHEVALEGLEEHRVAEEVLLSLQDLDLTDDLWRARFHVLKEHIERHLHDVETETFTKARKVVSDDEAEDMGAEFEEIKEDVMGELRLH